MKKRFVPACVLLLSLISCTSEGTDRPASNPNRSDSSSEVGAVTHGPPTSCGGRATTTFEGRRMAVRLRISACVVSRGKAPEAVLINSGTGELGYGFGFKLERKTKAGWRWINRKQAFVLPLFYLAPGERSDPESLAVYFDKPQPIGLRPGRYRVSKGVNLTPRRPQPPTMVVRATFQVI